MRDLSVAFGSLRAVRAEAPAQVPLIAADLKLDDGKVVGTITNQSDKVLEKPAVVLGSSAQVVGGDLAPGQPSTVDMRLEQNPFAVAQLSERIVGNAFFDGSGTFDAESQRKLVRRAIIDQLTFDPVTGFSNQFSADTALILAWGEDPVVPVEIEGQKSRRVGNVLYEVPVTLSVKGKTVFRSDLMRSSVVEVDAPFFNKDPWTVNFGNGTRTDRVQADPVRGHAQADPGARRHELRRRHRSAGPGPRDPPAGAGVCRARPVPGAGKRPGATSKPVRKATPATPSPVRWLAGGRDPRPEDRRVRPVPGVRPGPGVQPRRPGALGRRDDR